MTDKQQRFVAEYLKDHNATQAAKRAGYISKRLDQLGHSLLRKTEIISAIQSKALKVIHKAELTAQDNLEMMRRGSQYDARKLFDSNGNLKKIHELTEEEAFCIASFEVIIANAKAGDGHQDTIHKIRLINRATYVDMAAKYLGQFIADKQAPPTVNVQVNLVETLRRRENRLLEQPEQKAIETTCEPSKQA